MQQTARLLLLARLTRPAVAQFQQLSSREMLLARLGPAFCTAPTASLARQCVRHMHTAGGYLLPCFARQQLVTSRLPELVQRHRQHIENVTKQMTKLEAKVATVVNGLVLTSAGQMLMSVFLPVALLASLFPNRIHGMAYELPASALYNRHQPQQVFTPVTARIKKQQQVQQQLLFGLLANARGAISLALNRLGTELAIALRGMYLMALFIPVLLSAPAVFSWGIGRERWLNLLRWTLEQAGPAFIKWGQWGSTRPDLFPRDVCKALEALQSNAPAHAPYLSVGVVEAAFQRPLRELFSSWEEYPIASGSIAQIHRARLSPQAAASCGVPAGTLVAVKVRHPGVGTLMARDFVLMERAARVASKLPALKGLRLDESVRQFGGPLQEQLDLSLEAQHLDRFARNFRGWRNVKFPTPIYPLVREDVLVESFEPGSAINGYVAASAASATKAAMTALLADRRDTSLSNATPSSTTGSSACCSSSRAGICGTNEGPVCARCGGPAMVAAAADASLATSLTALKAAAKRSSDQESLRLRGAIAETGLHAYLKMLLNDNFIHADMHPGNILVREVDRSGGVAERLALLLKQLSWGLPLPGVREVFRNVVLPPTPQLVLLDTGMAAELSVTDQRSVVQFFKALTQQNGEGIARSILLMSERHTCPDPERFVSAVRNMFDSLDPEVIRTRTSEVLQDMIEQLRQHQVTLKSTVSTVVVTTLVLEGWSRELNPDLRIMDTLRDMLAVDWKERLSRAVDKVMAYGQLAVV
eukprot:GHRR01001165.1.p1 GENE.GHRR01001165.1~~GHRR01001165.1.p1  ORF type:complete len:760 (+),score=252.82 GHRR01001165.1:251-2530(+)